MLRRRTCSARRRNLFVADLPASCDFFGKTLGFTVDFTYGEPPFYGQVARDGGAPFHQALRSEPWGARTFIVRDLDGNLLLFAGD